MYSTCTHTSDWVCFPGEPLLGRHGHQGAGPGALGASWKSFPRHHPAQQKPEAGDTFRWSQEARLLWFLGPCGPSAKALSCPPLPAGVSSQTGWVPGGRERTVPGPGPKVPASWRTLLPAHRDGRPAGGNLITARFQSLSLLPEAPRVSARSHPGNSRKNEYLVSCDVL